jgi:hypothetical protein
MNNNQQRITGPASLAVMPAAQQNNTMALAMESRESQQVQVAMLAAKRFPRDEKASLDRILNACCRESLAAVSQYQFARGGTDISGPSIRLAEAIAQQWGNLECGWREIDRYKDADGVGVSVVEAYAWDMESNCRVPRVFNIRHWRDTKKGGYKIEDERDIYELCANQASRRLRACILAVIPGDIVEEAMKQCDVTLKAKADTGPEAQKKILEAFAEFNVTKAQIEAKIQRRITSITSAQVVTLRRIHASLKDGMSNPADWFEPAAESAAQAATSSGPINPFEKAEQPAEEAAPKEQPKAKQAEPKPAADADDWNDDGSLPM